MLSAIRRRLRWPASNPSLRTVAGAATAALLAAAAIGMAEVRFHSVQVFHSAPVALTAMLLLGAALKSRAARGTTLTLRRAGNRRASDIGEDA